MTVQQISVNFITRYSSRGVRQFQRDMAQVGATSQAASSKAASGLQRVGSASRAAGTALLIGVGAALAVGIKAAIQFEEAFAGVRKTVDASEPVFQHLANAIQEMSTVIPISATELARIAELGGQLGVPASELLDFTEIIAKVGTATNLEVDAAAKSMARFTNVLGTAPHELENVASALVDLGNNAAAEEDEILNFATRLAAIGSVAGLAEGEILGIAAAFLEMGVAPERGATAIQRAFVTMVQATRSGSEELTTLAEATNMTRAEFAELFDQDPAAAFMALLEGLQEITNQGGDATAVLADLGLASQRTLQAMLAGAENPSIVARNIERGNTAFAQNIALNEEAEKRFDTTQSQLTLMANAFKKLTTNIGGNGLSAFRQVIAFARALFEVIDENIDVLMELFKWVLIIGGARGLLFLAKSVGTAITALKGLKTVFSSLAIRSVLTSVSGMKGLFGALGSVVTALSGTLGLVALGIGAVGVAAAVNRSNMNQYREDISDLADEVERLLMTGGDLTSAFETFNRAMTQREKFLDTVVNLEDERGFLGSLGLTPEGFAASAIEATLGDPEDEQEAINEWTIKMGKITKFLGDRVGRLRQEFFEAQRDFGMGSEEAGIAESALAQAENDRDRWIKILNETQTRVFSLNAEQRRRAMEHAQEMSEIPMIFGGQGPNPFDASDIEEGVLAKTYARGFIGTEEELSEALGEITKVGEDFIEDQRDIWSEVVDIVTDNLFDWGTALDGFKATVNGKLGEISTSITEWLKEQRRITDVAAFIGQELGPQAAAFFLTQLDPEMQGRFAAEHAKGNVTAVIDTMNTILDAEQALMGEQLAQLLILSPSVASGVVGNWKAFYENELKPALLEEGFIEDSKEWDDAVVGVLTGSLDALRQEHPALAMALEDTLMAGARSAFEGEAQDLGVAGKVIDIIVSNASTQDKIKKLQDLGFSWADAAALAFATLPDIIDGLLDPDNALVNDRAGFEQRIEGAWQDIARAAAAGYSILPGLLESETAKAVAVVEAAAEKGLEIDSPSKVFMRIGQSVAAGFNLGVERGNMHFKLPHPVVSVQTPPSSVSRDLNINVNHPQHRSDDIIASLQESTMLQALVRTAEVIPGA